MLKNYKLLLDNDCPMCKVYGQLFVKLNLIEPSALTSFQFESQNSALNIDHERAKSEIAFYNTVTNETVYGVDAVVKIISHNFTLLQKFLELYWINRLLKFIYFFISYNRKQIIPVNPKFECYNCTPEYKLSYRWAYIIFVAFATAFILSSFFRPLFASFNLQTFFWIEYVICFGQILWQAVAIKYFTPQKTMDYLGNMSTVSMLGGILLIPLLMLSSLVNISITIKCIYFFIVVSIMVLEHLRRCFLLEISHFMTASWIAYRVFVLIILYILYNI